MLTDEKKLLTLVAEGDELAFSKLFTRYRNKIYGVSFKLTRCNLLAEEIVQEVFLKIWLKRDHLTEVQNFQAYLFVITKNHVFKALKEIAKSHKTSEIVGDEQFLIHNETIEQIEGKEYNLLLQNAINLLPNQQKLVFRLIKEQGLKREEVANKLNLQPETVKFHLAKAMKTIRTYFLPHLNLIIAFIIGQLLGY